MIISGESGRIAHPTCAFRPLLQTIEVPGVVRHKMQTFVSMHHHQPLRPAIKGHQPEPRIRCCGNECHETSYPCVKRTTAYEAAELRHISLVRKLNYGNDFARKGARSGFRRRFSGRFSAVEGIDAASAKSTWMGRHSNCVSMRVPGYVCSGHRTSARI